MKGMQESDRVLVIADRPNANVAFEAGLALGLGKMVALVHFGHDIPQWLKQSVFRGFIVNPVTDLRRLNDLLQNEAAWHRPAPAGAAPLVGDTLFLAPSMYVSQALRDEQATLFRSWETIPDDGINVNELTVKLGSVAQVVWSI